MSYEDYFEGSLLVAIKRTDEDGTVHSIPLDSGNRDYAEYLALQGN